MAATPKVQDGTFSFWGGMDLSRAVYELDPRQYSNGVNIAITPVGDNVSPRPGWHFQGIRWASDKERDYFENGNVQGGGWYFDGSRNCLAISVAGRIFYIRQEGMGKWRGRCVNLGSPNNPTRTKVWSCRIPGNRIVLSDGQARPYVLGLDGTVYRPDPSKGEMYPCQAMAYVQNRLWWVDSEGKILYGSDIQNPLSIQEAIDASVFGFVPGDDRETITAVGQSRYINRDLNGGELVFSTENNVYSVNVQADCPRQQWGYQSGVGTVRLVIPDSGATSAFSFASYNTNLFYRTRSLGVANYRQVQAQWANNDELISNSIEVDFYYSRDTEWMLDQCWSVNYKGRLLTTTSPTLANGYVYWRGLISMNPAPYYGAVQRLPRRFEGLWTGVRPWCLLHQNGASEKLYTISYDGDGKNRLYMMADNDRFDIEPNGRKKHIKCVLETRAYAFGSPYTMKITDRRFYTLDRIKSNVNVKGYSRSTLGGAWTEFWTIEHKLPVCCATPSGEENCYPFNIVAPETRNEFYITGEREKCSLYSYRQFRFEFVGEFELSAIGLLATVQPESSTVVCKEPDRLGATEPACELKLFDYIIFGSPEATTPTNAQLPNNPSNSSVSSCGC